jgi:hypothetical protein
LILRREATTLSHRWTPADRAVIAIALSAVGTVKRIHCEGLPNRLALAWFARVPCLFPRRKPRRRFRKIERSDLCRIVRSRALNCRSSLDHATTQAAPHMRKPPQGEIEFAFARLFASRKRHRFGHGLHSHRCKGKRYLGGCSPGELAHLSKCIAVSVCLTFLRRVSRSGPGGSRSASFSDLFCPFCYAILEGCCLLETAPFRHDATSPQLIGSTTGARLSGSENRIRTIVDST